MSRPSCPVCGRWDGTHSAGCDGPVYKPTVEAPDLEEYLRGTVIGEEYSSAIDGCEPVDPDGRCEHGAPSWELYWGVI